MFSKKKNNGLAADLDMGILVKRHELESNSEAESEEIGQANHIAKVIQSNRKTPKADVI